MKPSGRKVSAGTCIMLILTLIVVIGSVMVFIRLSSGNPIDFSRLSSNESKTGLSDSGKKAASEEELQRKRQMSEQYYAIKDESTKPSSGGSGGRFTLTVAGTAALEGDIRKSCYLSELKKYDVEDIMMLLRSNVQSDINIVFLENLLMDNEKVSDIIAPSAAAEMLSTAGFNMAACGFQGSWNKKADGIAETRSHLSKAGITPVGIYDPGDLNRINIMNCGGIPTAFLQYTGTISQNDRKKMDKENMSGAVPAADAELISADIAQARSQGADLVIVLMNWGSRAKAPDKKQKALAQQIADAGADIIIGSGSRIPQAAEYIEATGNNGKQVLCIWSLGVTITKDRSSAGRMAGYLFQAEFMMDDAHHVTISEPSFTPVYTWMYTQDKRTYYRCLAANGTIPDGMEVKQQNAMSKAADVTREALKDSPLAEK